MKCQDYWNNVFKDTNSAGTLLQTNSPKFIAELLSFTFSNALVERVFIQLKLIKNDHRIPQKHEYLLALMQTKDTLVNRETESNIVIPNEQNSQEDETQDVMVFNSPSVKKRKSEEASKLSIFGHRPGANFAEDIKGGARSWGCLDDNMFAVHRAYAVEKVPTNLKPSAILSHSSCVSGTVAGTVLGMTLSGAMAWPAVFYFFGLLAIIWSVFWFWMVTDSPFDHPTITDKELAYIKQELSDDKTESKLTTVPWKELLTSVPMWAIMIAHFAGNWGFITLFTSLPTYLKQMLKFDLQKAGFLSALPYLIMTIVIQLGGQLADFLRSSGRMSTTTVRKLFTAIGFMSQGLFVIIVGYSTSKYMAMFALVMAVGFDGFAYSGFIINHLDIAPRYASLLFGMSNTFATIPGIVGPLVVGFVTTHETREEWQIIFFLVAAVYALGTLVFLIFASGKKQSWADPNGYQSISEDNDDKDMLMKEKIEDEKGTPQLPMKQMRGKNQNL
eukprot:gene16420-7827_t